MKRLTRNRPLLLTLAMAIAAPALAQSAGDVTLDTRMRKIEAEVSALQRVVFPGGDGRFFPQLQPSTSGTSPVGTPASNPNTDMLTRMDALEGQVAKLTAQVEEDRNRMDKMDARVAALEAGKSNPVEAVVPAAAIAKPPVVVVTPAPKPVPVIVAKPADPSAKRLAAVRAVAKPQTDDAGDDEYSYGFRLWEARFYPEAQQQLKLFLTKYPKHTRGSYARNLLGRAYLDEGNPREAASWFLQNYKAQPNGDRAPDSVLLLAESMRQMKDTNRACVALDQFTREFPAEAAGRLKSQYDTTRGGLKCPA